MQERTVVERLQILEQQVSDLASLPDRVAAVELTIRQFRDEARAEFSALRGEMRALEGGLRQEMRALEGELRQEMRALNEQTRLEMHALNEETRRHMLVLHEEVIARIAGISEGNRRRRR